MKITLFILYISLICSYIHAEFCQKDDCRGGDCEMTKLLNGTIKKICHCAKGVCGETCQRLCNTSSQCDTNPCWFGGTCVDVTNLDYICVCPPNYSGKDCRNLVSCKINICFNGGTCVQTAYGAKCNCPEDIHGDYCQYRQSTKSNKTTTTTTNPIVESRQIDANTLSLLADSLSSSNTNNQRAISYALAMNNGAKFVFCLTNPCENGGTCFVTNTATTKGLCICRGGYHGDYCEHFVNKSSNVIKHQRGYCSSNPCFNDGTCIEIGDFNGYCRCTPEYRGVYCEIYVRSHGCNPNPCKNGGTCVVLENNQAQCLCSPVFRGVTCNQFSYVPCGDATCHGTQGLCVGNKCVCKTGFAGPRCDSIDFCSPDPCLNGGTCIRTNEEPYGGCSCPSEYSGPTCSNDPCVPTPCLNGGVCIRKADNQFYCQCRSKNRGVFCEQSECFPSDATVYVLNVGKVELSSLKIGDQVRVVNEENQIIYSPIIAFLHREVDEEATYKRIRTKNTIIELSARHLIERRNDGFIWAEKLEKGNEIRVLSSKHGNQTNWQEIIEITEVDKQGLMAPLTEQGTIIVNNVHTSCYALVKSHKLAHYALAPYRLYRRIFGGRETSDRNISPILTYAKILLQLIKTLPFAKDFIF